VNQSPSPKNPDQEKRLNAILAEYLKRKDAGQEVSQDAMLKAYPDHADELRSYFAGEALMNAGAPAFAATKLSPIPVPSESRETLRPGAIHSDTASEFTSRKFGRYQLLRPLGEGAMGSVYLALDTTLDRQVALNIPKIEGTANAEFMARFAREAKAAASLKHPNICSVYDTGEHEGTSYITMDFIDGVPLSRFIGSEKLQSVDSILYMITTIAEAVGHAHSKGVIHRDLKPGNILIDADFKPHVTDFGLARRAGGAADESRITQEGLLIGTPAYMAPEQVKGEQSKVGPQSDIYSLGVILFELLTCRLPFEGKMPEMLAKVLRDDPPVPSRIRKDLTNDVDELCLKMLQKEPERRFASIMDVISGFAEVRRKIREDAVPCKNVTARPKTTLAIEKTLQASFLRKPMIVAALVGLITLIPIFYCVIMYLKSGNQIIAVHVDDEWLKLLGGELTLMVDGNSRTISAQTKTGDALAVTVSLGPHTFSVKHGDTVVHDPKTFQIERDGRRVLHIRKEDLTLSDVVPSKQRNRGVASVAAVQSPSGPPLAQGHPSDNSTLPPLAIAPFDARQAKKFQDEWAAYAGEPIEYENSIGMTLQLIPPGEFMMGSPEDEPGRDAGEKQHRVRLTKPFYMGACEVTLAQFEAFVNETGYKTEAESDGLGGRGWDDQGEFTNKPEYIWRTPGFPQTDTHPVVHVSWNDAHQFTIWLSRKEAVEYRLPTEAEWEYACRAGSTTWYSNGNDPEKLAIIGNIADPTTLAEFPEWTGAITSSDGQLYTAPVASFQPNAFALYDLHGNVWEWCQDRYDYEAYTTRTGTTVDPFVEFGVNRLLRNGGWTTYPENVRAAARSGDAPNYRFASLGFRVARSIAKASDSGTLANKSMTLLPTLPLKGFAEIHGANTDQLRRWADNLPKGYRPYWISVRANSTELLFDALATVSADQGKWDLQILDTEHAGDSESFERTRFERRIVALSNFRNGNNERFGSAVVWADGEPSQWWWGGLDSVVKRIQEGIQDQRDVVGLTEAWLPNAFIANDTVYHVFLTRQKWHQCQTEFDLSLDELIAKTDEYRAKGWRLHIVNAVNYVPSPVYVAVFIDNPDDESWEFSPRLTIDEYRQKLMEVDAKGGQPRCVVSRETDDEVIYTAVWDDPTPVIAPFRRDAALRYQETWARYLKLPVEHTNSIGMKFRLIPPGEFVIGSTPEQIEAAKPHLYVDVDPKRSERAHSEGPQRRVRISRPFYIGTTEVTQKNYSQVVGTNPSTFAGFGTQITKVERSQAPVEHLTWLESIEFCRRLSELERLDSAELITPNSIVPTSTEGYRLPTEAEWEFACRAGTITLFWSGDDEDSLLKNAWYGPNNSPNGPKTVATLASNPFGLFDMHGNVWEWVHDGWVANQYEVLQQPIAGDPRSDVAEEGRRVIRGGDFFMSSAECRSACRDGYHAESVWDDVGFRVALSVEAVQKLQMAKEAEVGGK